MEANETNLNVKLAQLQLTGKRTTGIISSGKQEVIERHCQTLKTISSEINVMRISVEAEKIIHKVEIEDIVERKKGVETKLAEADEEIEKIGKWLADCKEKADEEAQEEELRFQEKLHQTKLNYETDLQAVKSERPQHENGEF